MTAAIRAVRIPTARPLLTPATKHAAVGPKKLARLSASVGRGSVVGNPIVNFDKLTVQDPSKPGTETLEAIVAEMRACRSRQTQAMLRERERMVVKVGSPPSPPRRSPTDLLVYLQKRLRDALRACNRLRDVSLRKKCAERYPARLRKAIEGLRKLLALGLGNCSG